MRTIPLISVLIPVYNCEPFLAASISSILMQTVDDFELIIVNDASTDTSVKIVKDFADQRIILLDSKEKMGISNCLNAGIEIARGKYIARMDADDISYPCRFEEQLHFLSDNPSVAICGSHMNLIDELGASIKLQRKKLGFENIRLGLFFGETSLAHPSIMINAQQLKERGILYNPTFEYAEDYELYCRCSQSLRLDNIDKVLIEYRIHSRSVSRRQAYRQRLAARQALQEHVARLGLHLSKEAFSVHCACHLPMGEVISNAAIAEWTDTLTKWNQQHKVFREKVFLEKISVAADRLYQENIGGRQ